MRWEAGVSPRRPTLVGLALAAALVGPILAGGLSVFAHGPRSAADRARHPVTGLRREGSSDRPAADSERGLAFRLSEGAESAQAPSLVARPLAQRISDLDARRLLERLPPLAEEPPEVAFSRRKDSPPPPRTGRTLEQVFPPAHEEERPQRPHTGPLEVLRRMPDGEVPLAPRLSLTFSQPMVPVTSHATLAQGASPVSLSPQPPGEWRWVGTRTLVFEPKGRFPMATDYSVVVPAGTRGVDGSLDHAVSWTFSTPPPGLLARHPEGGAARRDSLMFAGFDQAIDPAAVLGTVRVRVLGRAVRTRLATDEEVKADEAVAALVRRWQSGRWLAFRAEEPLPADAAVAVVVGLGTASAEGPRRTSAAQEWTFHTHGRFRVRRHQCGWSDRCTPFDSWRIETTNPVDAKTLNADRVRVEPNVLGLKVTASGDTILLNGPVRGHSSYRVTLSPEIRDVFGQSLEPGAPLEFTVGPAPAALFAPGGDFVVLDPGGGPRFPVYSVNHSSLRVEAWQVGPGDWAAWHEYRRRVWRNEAAEPPGRRVLDTTVRVAGQEDELVETRLDLGAALAGGQGQLVLVVRPTTSTRERPNETIRVWVQKTRIGLDAFADADSLVVWASDLAGGRPLGGVLVSLEPGASARTDASGIARLALGETAAPLLVARLGADVAMLPVQSSFWAEGAGWRRGERQDELRFCVFDDRKMYRSGERVRVKGWLRTVGAGPRGDVGPVPSGVTSVGWTLRDALDNEIGKGETPVERLGGFSLALELPKTMSLGTAVLQLEAEGTPLPHTAVHTFEVREFRRPEFEVKAEASEGPFFVGGQATVTVSASYYAGGALPGAEVSWRVASRPAFFRPPNRDDYVFGPFVPWWDWRPAAQEPERVREMAARTDSRGVHRLRIDFDRGTPPRPRLVEAEATVMDVNRQAWTVRADLLVHPASTYVGLRADRPFVGKGEPVTFDVIATDLDGRALAGRSVSLRLGRLDWEQVEGEWKETTRDTRERVIDSSKEPVRVRFEGLEGGTWKVRARVLDEQGRENETEMQVFVAGGRVPPRRELEQEKVTLVPDRKEYRRGDVARVLVIAPFAPAEGLLTLRRSGLVREERFSVETGSRVVEVKVEEGFTPNVHVQVDLVGAAAREEATGASAPSRPAFATGSALLSVPPASRTLSLEVTPREPVLAPGGETVLDVFLRDAAGRPVEGGEAAVVVVDEAVLALTGYRLPNPTDVFYSGREAGVSDSHLRAQVLLAQPEGFPQAEEATAVNALARGGTVLATAGAPPVAAPMMLDRATPPEQKTPAPLSTRTDFSALALFAASLPTDTNGRASVTVKVPDNLTRYRVMAVAVAGAREFGAGESTLVARLPLMVRPSPPRFLNFGDRFSLPVVVQNQTDGEMTVDVAVRAANADLVDGAGRRLVVAANDRAEVLFPMAAARAGRARIQVAAASGPLADAAEVELPVRTPATTEAFASYGQIDQGAIVQPVEAPTGVFPEFGGLEVTTSSTALQALTDAVLYLVRYPFECAEQLSSRVLAVAALRDVLAAFQAEGLPKPDAIREAVKKDVERLRALQNDDGGFAFWRRGDPSWPYVSIHAAHALALARAKGFAVPDEALDRSRRYLRDIRSHVPADYGTDVRRTLEAYALSVRALMNDADPDRARALVREAGASGLSFEAIGWILPVLSGDQASAEAVAALRRRLANGVEETASAAHFAVSYGDGDYLLLRSDRRADAILLDALIVDQPKSDLVPKLAEGLLAHRTAGHWSSTQENVFVLLALDRYFQTYERVTPDFVARVWLGERYAGDHAFRGRTTERSNMSVPMGVLRDARPAELVLAKDGPGRLYYRIGLRYAPASLSLERLDRGFTVERDYEAVDQASDVRLDGDGAWHVRAGSRVRVRLTMVAPARRYHVALVDPLPAGFEPLDPALATTGTVPSVGGSEVTPLGAVGLGGPRVPGKWWWWSRPWFEHQSLRDDRVEAFASLLWEGVHTYAYVARATTPGTFVVPPTKAEEMYAPETFGRGASDRVIVE
jgi:alpha-2-macroglobulin